MILIFLLTLFIFITIVCGAYTYNNNGSSSCGCSYNNNGSSGGIFIDNCLYVKHSPKGGYGVYTSKFIPAGKTIEVARTLKIKDKERKNLKELAKYDYNIDLKTTCVALGYGSLYNHDANNNVEYSNTYGDDNLMHYTTLKDVEPHQELYINYGDDYFTSNNITQV